MRRLLAPAVLAASCFGFTCFGLAPPAAAFWHDAGCAGACGPRGAGSGPSCYDYLEQGREENNLWPQQYLGADRRNAMAPFDTMIRNGWRRQNLLGSHHFDAQTTQLTKAGRLRVRWILTQTPPEHRQVFIERSIEEGVTDARIAATRDFSTRVLAGEPAAIAETHLLSDGRPAVVIDYVNTQYRENMMTPVLPQEGAGAGVPE